MIDWFDLKDFPLCVVCEKKDYCLKANRIGMLLTRYGEICKLFKEVKK